MRTYLILFFALILIRPSLGQLSPNPNPLPGTVPAFEIASTDLTLSRIANPNTYFDKTGRRFAILGTESGSFEAWAYPIKLFRDFSLSFFIGSSTEPILARDIVTDIVVSPHVTSITYVFQSFTVKAHYVTSVDLPGAVILLDVDSSEPLSIVAGLVPTLSPMWPAGIGGQYAYWDDRVSAYLISESSYKNHGYVGSRAAANLSYTPAHMLSDRPNQFSIRIDDPARVVDRFIPIAMAGGTGERSAVEAVFNTLITDPETIYNESRKHFEDLRNQTVRVHTPDERLNRAVEWAKIAYDNLLVSNPHLPGTGLVAGLDRSGSGGRPGFGWFFGGDSYINSLSLTALGYFDAAKKAISFMTQFQREDGKMAHEITQATEYVDWFGDYPYAFIHADTSPYFIVAVNDYYEATGDLEFVRDQFPSMQRAYEWSRETDGDGDGLMDNSLAGLGALEFGALTDIQSDVYLNAVWMKASESMGYLAGLVGEDALSETARNDHAISIESFEKYWSERAGQYVYAFNEQEERVEEITPWSAVALMFSYGSDDRARASLTRMAMADLTSDWGVRMLSTDSEYFEPLNYNYGAVWPFLTSWVSTAQYARGLPLQGYSGLMSTIQHVENRSLGQVTEVFSGLRHTWPQESVPHQGFCTAGTVLPVVRGMLGLSSEQGANRLVFRPALPGDWKTLNVENYRLGASSVNIDLVRDEGRMAIDLVTDASTPVGLLFEPTFAPGTSVLEVRVDGESHPYDMESSPHHTKASLSVTFKDRIRIEVDLVSAFEIIPPVWESVIGDASKGLRINRYERKDSTAELEVQGLAGRTYRLRTMHADHVTSIEGATLQAGQDEVAGRRSSRADTIESRLSRADQSDLLIQMPERPDGGYTSHTVRIHFE